MKGTAHDDFLEEDISMVWNKIKNCKKNQISFKNICEELDSEGRIKVFLSILFLAYENKINIYQRKFPFGEIFIKTKGYT
jgi:chromatin segregation and condensation protein Rec8/ScpA/Scc1 (kleisin family)